MQQLTGAQAVGAILAWAVLAIVVPLFGIVLIPVVALATMGRALIGTVGAVAQLVRPAPGRWPRVPAPGLYGWQR